MMFVLHSAWPIDYTQHMFILFPLSFCHCYFLSDCQRVKHGGNTSNDEYTVFKSVARADLVCRRWNFVLSLKCRSEPICYSVFSGLNTALEVKMCCSRKGREITALRTSYVFGSLHTLHNHFSQFFKIGCIAPISLLDNTIDINYGNLVMW